MAGLRPPRCTAGRVQLCMSHFIRCGKAHWCHQGRARPPHVRWKTNTGIRAGQARACPRMHKMHNCSPRRPAPVPVGAQPGLLPRCPCPWGWANTWPPGAQHLLNTRPHTTYMHTRCKRACPCPQRMMMRRTYVYDGGRGDGVPRSGSRRRLARSHMQAYLCPARGYPAQGVAPCLVPAGPSPWPPRNPLPCVWRESSRTMRRATPVPAQRQQAGGWVGGCVPDLGPAGPVMGICQAPSRACSGHMPGALITQPLEGRTSSPEKGGRTASGAAAPGVLQVSVKAWRCMVHVDDGRAALLLLLLCGAPWAAAAHPCCVCRALTGAMRRRTRTQEAKAHGAPCLQHCSSGTAPAACSAAACSSAYPARHVANRPPAQSPPALCPAAPPASHATHPAPTAAHPNKRAVLARPLPFAAPRWKRPKRSSRGRALTCAARGGGGGGPGPSAPRRRRR